MDSPVLAYLALTVPLSAWGLQRAYSSLIADNSHVTLSSYIFFAVLSFIAIRTNLSLVSKYRFQCRARAQGCGSAAVFPHKDPILGLDAFAGALSALKEHKLYDFYASRFASSGNTYYMISLGRWLLMTNEAENVKAILGTKMDDWPIDGPRLLATLPVLGPDSIFTSNGDGWHRARALVKPSFVRDQVADLGCFARHVGNLMAAIPADDTTFDLQTMLLDMTMDSSTDFLLGCSTGLLTKASPEARQFVKNFEYASRESARKAHLGPLLYNIPHRGLEKAVRGLREYVRFYLRKASAEKEASKSKERNYVFLDELLKANPPEEFVIDQILSILIAGRDTTASAMAAAFYFLARNPAAAEKLREEIKSVGDEDPTWEQLKQMKYLNNVIKESMSIPTPSTESPFHRV